MATAEFFAVWNLDFVVLFAVAIVWALICSRDSEIDKLPFCLNWIIVLFARFREFGDIASFSLLFEVMTLLRSPLRTAFTMLAAVVIPAAV